MMKTLIAGLLFTVCLFAVSVSAKPFSVMTYNIRLDVASDGENRWEKRRGFFISQVRFHEPAILGVQEALPNQINEIAGGFPEYARIGIGRDGNGRGEASAIFYDKKRFRVSNEGTFWLSETPDKVSKSWDAAIVRICTFGLFRDSITKQSVWIFNTHLDHIGEVSRLKSMDLILAKIAEINKKNLPVILMGDFNAEPGSALLKNLGSRMNDARDVSLKPSFGPSGTFNAFDHSKPVTRIIDYIFVDKSNKLRVRKHGVLSDSINLRFPSDHFPVIAELEFSR